MLTVLIGSFPFLSGCTEPVLYAAPTVCDRDGDVTSERLDHPWADSTVQDGVEQAIAGLPRSILVHSTIVSTERPSFTDALIWEVDPARRASLSRQTGTDPTGQLSCPAGEIAEVELAIELTSSEGLDVEGTGLLTLHEDGRAWLEFEVGGEPPPAGSDWLAGGIGDCGPGTEGTELRLMTGSGLADPQRIDLLEGHAQSGTESEIGVCGHSFGAWERL